MSRTSPFLSLLIGFVVDTLAVLLCSTILSGVHVNGFLSAFLLAIALALLNQFLKPLLILFTLPVSIVSFGFFIFVINACIILLADWMVTSVDIDGFWWAMLFSLVLTLVKSLLNIFRQPASTP